MVTLITGNKGSGKTKLLIDGVNAAVQSSKGNVICIEKGQKLTYDISSRARLISADDFNIEGYDAFYGFLSGICAQDHDITDVFVDETLKICGRDYAALEKFMKRIFLISNKLEVNLVFTVSEDKAKLPKDIFGFCEEITF